MAEVKVKTPDGADGTVSESTVADFGASLKGTLLQPGDASYDGARAIWNAMIDRKPSMIARCADPDDVVSAVNFAQANNLMVSVRGGDHSAAGNAMCDGGLVIDLAPMNGVDVDPAARTVRVGGGARWREFDSATLAHGLATTGGTNSDTGVGGLTLGGGLGWLAGKYGLTCDNVISVDLVTADGGKLRASAEENPDLYWGVRGGSGNFGVATSFEIRVHPVDTVLGGLVIHPIDNAREVLRFYSDFTSDIPDELNTVAALLYSPEGQPVVGIGACYNGPIDEGEKVLKPLREFGPPVADQLGPMPYAAIQTMLDEAAPRGRRYYWKASFVESISGDLVDGLVDHFAQVPSPLSFIVFQQFGNAVRRVGADETAFSHRDASYDCVAIAGWEDRDDDEKNVSWTREFFDITQKHSSGGLYVNSVVEADATSMRAAFRPETFDRLVQLKDRYDPQNFFRNNPNIAPTR